jgi:AcrR family transcriptional regulator
VTRRINQGLTEPFGQFLMADMANMMAPTDAANWGEIGQPSADDGVKRRQIIDGAREIFMSVGFDAASMNDIARAASVSKGTLYAYFDSKEALFEALIREERAHQPERNMMFPADEPDPAKALAIYGRVLVAHVTRPEALTQARVVVAAAGKFPRLGRAFYEAGPLFGVLKLKERLDAFVAAGSLTIADTTLAARLFIDMCTGDFIKRLLFMVDEKIPQEEIDAAVDQSVAIFINACSAPPRG